MKKAAMNKVASELGFNKVAFAHHVDDALETLLMNEIYGGRISTFTPKMHLERADITFIRPLILCKEHQISSLIKEENLPVSPSCCPSDKFTTREDIKNILNNIYKQYPEAKSNFITMLSNYEKNELWDEEIIYQINSDGLTLKLCLNQEDFANATNIRHQVFVKEYNILFEDEFVLEYEKSSTAFLIYKNSTPIGTIRYRKTDYGYKIERFAILKEYRNLGYGKSVINFFSNYLYERFNSFEIYLHAMEHLKDFYIKCGLNPVGDIFYEANIPHIKFIYKK
jgi:predicted GNAT family N-acyltransferase